MAKRIKSISSLLDELDQALYEGRWRDVEAALRKTNKRSTVPETFSRFVEAEEQVERQFLGRDADLPAAETLLGRVIGECQPGHDAALQQLAKIKYGQLLWLRGEYGRALDSLREGVQAQATDDTSLAHTCRTLAEGKLFLGLCLEQCSGLPELVPAASLYEDALRLSLAVLHQARGSPAACHAAVFKVIKTALERGALLYMCLGMPGLAVNMYRRVLQSREEELLHALRQLCATALASLLLFHLSPASHIAPRSSGSFPTSLSLLSPAQLQEETLLVGLISEAFTSAWTVSKSDPVPSPAVVFDLFSLALTDLQLHSFLVQALEDGMRFACLMPHVLFQFALALVSAGRSAQALAVFHECVSLAPRDVLVLAVAAKFALERAGNPQLCIDWARQAILVAGGHFLEARLEFLLGRGCIELADREPSSQKRGELHKQGICHLKRAVQLDSQNIDYVFHLGLQYAESRELAEAHLLMQQALGLNAGHTSCLHLLALILAAQKQYGGALKVCDFALQKQPENFGLLECKIKLEAVTAGWHQALATCQQSLRLWQSLFAEEGSGLIGLVTQDQRSLSDLPAFDRPDTGPEPASPDVASDAGSSHFSLSATQSLPSAPLLLQARIWCTVAEVFVLAGKLSDAVSCVREAQYLAPHLASVLVAYGRVLELEGQREAAVGQYRGALVLQPGNPSALTLLGRLLLLSGQHGEAEHLLRQATLVDQLCHDAWSLLGRVFAARGQHELSAECLKTSLELEQTSPLQPFSAVLSTLVPAS